MATSTSREMEIQIPKGAEVYVVVEGDNGNSIEHKVMIPVTEIKIVNPPPGDP